VDEAVERAADERGVAPRGDEDADTRRRHGVLGVGG
jgi:hypothetical protein